MKFKHLVILALFLVSISLVNAYEYVCFEDGENMWYDTVTCDAGPDGCCKACAHDLGYNSNINNCVGLSTCECDGIFGNAFDCVETWECTEWSDCSLLGSQTRTCSDLSSCGTVMAKPLEEQNCDATEPTNMELAQRVEALESDVSALQSLLSSIQDLINSIIARLTVLEGGNPVGCLYDNPVCEAGYSCENNECVQIIQGTGCEFNNPACDPGFSCVSNVCVEDVPVGCAFNNPNCEDGYECVQNVCEEIIPPGCAYDNPSCDPGYVCQDNSCVIATDEVIFRTNVASSNYGASGSEMVFDKDNDGDLDCFSYSSYYRSYRASRPNIVAYTPEGYEVHEYSSGRVLVDYGNHFIYTPSDSCSTSMEEYPVEPYASNGQELYS